MHRRPLGRGRILAALGSLVLLAGSVLPWWRVGGANGIPAVSGNAFEATGIVVFLVALATLALVTMPYARDTPVALDRWTSYVILAVAAALGFGIRVADLILAGGFRDGFLPDRAPGVWVVAVGLVLLGRAAFEIADEPPRR